MTIQELSEQIQIHDHHHAMSDDNKVYLRGRTHYELIHKELKKHFVRTSDRCRFWNDNTPEYNHYKKDYINKLIEQGD